MFVFYLVFIQLCSPFCKATTQTNTTSISGNKLLLISFDGFRYDYLDKALSFGVNISGFQRIWASGFRIMRVENEFITRTAPNHFSMVTGQHEETHGLIDNEFFDPTVGKLFRFSDQSQISDASWFDVGGEPIWVTNQKHGHRTGVTSWPGSLAPIKGLLPSIRYPAFDPTIPLRNSMDNVLGWLEQDVNLALLYHPQPDIVGHETGPASTKVMNVIAELSHDLEYLLDKIKSSPTLSTSLSIILTSDHGMTDTDPWRIIILDDYLSDIMYTSPGSTCRVIWHLWPKGDFTADDLVSRLKNKHPKMYTFLKEDLPRRLFYSNNHRIAPVVAFAEIGWMIAKTKADATAYQRRGEHGYDPSSPEMSPFFLAMGPAFRPFPPNHTIPSIKLVDIYPLMCQLLGLDKPGPHNGSLSRVAYLLRTPHSGFVSWFHSTVDSFTAVFVFIIVGISSFTLVAVAFLVHCRLRNMSTQKLRRARQRRSAQQGMEENLLLRRLNSSGSYPELARDSTNCSSDKPQPEDVQRLLLASTEDDEVEQFNRPLRFEVDESTFLGLLRDPHSRFP